MNWEAIRKEFEESDITMKDLAEKHGIKPGTLRSRKNREKWEKRNAAKNFATRNATKRKNVATQKAIEQINDNSELNDQQKLFCLYYSQNHNATKSYQMAYDVEYKTAHANSYRLMAKDGIRAEIKRIKQARINDWLVDDTDIINEWMKQAFTDITDYVEFRKVFVDYSRDDEDMPKLDEFGEMIPYYRNELHFKKSSEVDGTVIQEVKKGKDGVSVKLYDKQRALIELQKLIGGENALKLQLMQSQIDKLQESMKVDTSAEDRLKGYFEKLGAEIDGS
ncbi:terminase small subunit [Desemzia sp. FAM 23989]|uniref:terminase small subunit n=1 Tax=Desemzia sp. FAM 23989 TaxID=3259523 RepID=UPI0038883375